MKDKDLKALISHYRDCLGEIELIEYNSIKKTRFNPQLILSQPNEFHNCNVIATVGLSDVKLKGLYTNCELVMLLDKKWKFKLDNVKWSWPFEMLNFVCNQIATKKPEIGYGKYFENEKNQPFSPTTNMSVAVIGIPVMFDVKFFELWNGKKRTNIFIITPATNDELKIIKKMGGINFIQHYLMPEGEDAFVFHNK